MKERHFKKIQQLEQALIAAGFVALDDQAKVLGLSRSTTWTILRAPHKNSLLSAAVIERMLASPALPPSARSMLMEYVEEKASGLYGPAGRARTR